MDKIDKRKHDSTKLLWHMDRVMAHFDRGERVAPIHLDVGIAKFCNVACVFCYGKFQNIQPVYISRDALLQTVSDAAEIGVRSIAFIGDGEPTMNPALYDALTLGKSLGLSMAISTNGALVDNDEKRKAILESCEWMRFCFSAGTREGYRAVHGKDYFDKVTKNISDIVAYKKEHGLSCEIGMQSVFVPTTMKEEMLEESKLAVALGVDYFVIKQCSLPDGGESGMATFDLNEYDSEETNSVLRQCEEQSTDKTDVIVKWNIMKQKGSRPYKGCPSLPFILEMSGNGDFFPCGHMFGGKVQFEKYKLGNVHETRLRDIFNSEHYWNVISEMRNNFNVQEQCKGACRQDMTNQFCWQYLNKPHNINFI